MNVNLAYLGHSAVREVSGHQLLSLAPNLTRDPVAFDAALLKPLRFREAISALHDTVISDLRFKKRDKAAYLEWKKNEAGRDRAIRQQAYAQAMKQIETKRGVPVATELKHSYDRARKRYWGARQAYSNYLLKHDPALWRQLMPCDPVITVTDDVVFFECFSADESSYGCLTVERDGGFGKSDNLLFGTTNVDYSWDLYHHFQTLRTYRQTRFRIDPAGFEVATNERPDYREEKIDLPDGWLRGFMQIQAAMCTPTIARVSLSREAVYSILAWLKRHKARASPRAVRFELLSGKPPRVVLEPWEQAIVSYGTTYDGPNVEPIRVWGSRRLLVLARVLALAERFDVYLPGTGLPSFWVAHLGEMRLTLGLSGWTTNDWTRGSAIDLLAPPAAPSPDLVANVAATVRRAGAMTPRQVEQSLHVDGARVATALRELAHSGQVIFDLAAGVVRWRQVMPKALGEAEIGPEHRELAGARQIMQRNRADLESRQDAPDNKGTVLGGKVDGCAVEMLVDPDQRIRRGSCVCTYYRKFALKNGPCRHMLALRWRASVGALEAYRASGWYNRLLGR
ncbi:MAG: metal-binding protein [Tepidisphaeraceae bacterium]